LVPLSLWSEQQSTTVSCKTTDSQNSCFSYAERWRSLTTGSPDVDGPTVFPPVNNKSPMLPFGISALVTLDSLLTVLGNSPDRWNFELRNA
jgi:hypothetical protein